jgi:predicted Zn-dependent protease
MEQSLHDQLQRAYQLIKVGDKQAALDILRPICRDYPNNEEAWWLAAHALSDPQQVRQALQRVLQINPFHEKALAKLDKVNLRLTTLAQPTPAVKLETTALPKPTSELTPPKQASGQGGWLVLGAVSLVLVVVTVVGVWVVLSGNSEEAAITLPTRVSTVVAGVQANATFTPIPTKTRPVSSPLPPTWTPSPTFTPDTSIITNTPISFATPVRATADPALFGDTYWYGIGDGYTLETFKRSGERYLRFYDFPVTVFVKGAGLDPIWEQAVQNAIEQVAPVVPMERVPTEGEATLVIFIMEPSEYERWSGCPQNQTAGCAFILDVGDFGGGDTYHRIIGDVYLNTAASNPIGTLLHEVLHALGLMVHSPEQGDIMYPVETDRTTLSQRDLNTLRRLYANPSYAD